MEKLETERLRNDNEIIDYVICGGAMEGHALQKEVNYRGEEWSSITAH